MGIYPVISRVSLALAIDGHDGARSMYVDVDLHAARVAPSAAMATTHSIRTNAPLSIILRLEIYSACCVGELGYIAAASAFDSFGNLL